MIFLPTPRPAHIRAFGVTIALGTALLGAGIALIVGNPKAALESGAVLFVMVSLLGIVSPTATKTLYRGWNAAAHAFARLARLVLMSTCFYIVFVAVGRTGTSIKLFRPRSGQSHWTEKKPLLGDALGSEVAEAYSHMTGDHWLRNFLQWSKESRQIWVIVLVPFLAMLAAVEAAVDRRFPSGVYTLF